MSNVLGQFLDQLFQSPVIFFIIAAVILIVLAIIGKIPLPSSIDLDPRQRAGLAAFGTILIVFSVVVTSIEVRPPGGGGIVAPPSAISATKDISSTSLSACSSSASTIVTITTPTSESKVPILTTVQGAACHIPNGEDLWVLIVPDGVTAYYPQPGPVVVTSDGKWSASATIGRINDPVKGFVMIAALANQDGSTVIRAYFNQSGSDTKGLDPLPGGIQLISQVHVVRE